MAVCERCGRELTRDEIALYRKMVRRDAETYLCIGCLAETFQTSPEALQKLIEGFRRAGCRLFA